jgi:hypothetical protein
MIIIPKDTKYKLPADAYHPLIAVSLNRKLRYMYDGSFFRFREGGEDKFYPASDISEGSKLVEIYDQKQKYGYPVFNAIQEDSSKQPTLEKVNGTVMAVFRSGEYLEFAGNPAQFIDKDFTITTIGESDFPRPMLAIWGASDSITVEPGDKTSRFTFNNDMGSISPNSNNKVMQLFSGVESAQNGKQVISMKSDNGGEGHLIPDNTKNDFNKITIGKVNERYFSGSFTEATIHLGDTTKLASEKIWEEAKIAY